MTAVRSGDVATAVRLNGTPSLRASSHRLWETEISLADGTAVSVVVKDGSTAGLLPEAREVRPEFLFDPDREFELYRSVLDHGRLGTAQLVAAVPVEGGWRLALERVDGTTLEETGFGSAWLGAARWLARFHRLLATAVVDCEAILLRYDLDFFSIWPERACALASWSSTTDTRDRDRLRSLARRYGPVADALAELPGGLVHGDFHASNVIVARRGPAMRVCPVDWELAGRGPHLLDLAALTSGTWHPVERAAVVDAYLDACAGGGHDVVVPDTEAPGAAVSDTAVSGAEIGSNASAPICPTLSSVLDLLDLCDLHLAVQWLGWGPGWAPEHRRSADWIQVATACADRLGL